MMDTLHAEVLPPRHHAPWVRILAIALGGGLAVGGIVLSTLLSSDARVAIVVRPPTPAPPARVISSEIHLVFHAGGHSYIKLGPAEGIPHGTPVMIDDDGVRTALAPIALDHVPTDDRAWIGRKMTVDNDCTATIVGYAVASRLTGEIGYSESHDEQWTAASVMEQGAQVLVGELDRCDGTYARSASLPPIVVPERMADDALLIAKARKLLLASNAATATDADWTETETPTEGDWRKQAQLDTRVLKHPLTGETWVSIHAFNEHGCGEAEINLWGLYRVMPDGTLDPVQVRKLGDMVRIEQIIDVEGDGELELIGPTWLGDTEMVTRGSGEAIESLSLPYFGCPC